MVNKGNSAIWRVPATDINSSHSEPSTGGPYEKIEFDLDAVTPDTTGHISNTQGEVKTGIAENEAPFRNVNEKQFTGVEYLTLTITGHIQNPDASIAETTMKVWILEAQDTSIYTNGRFGIRLNDFPIFNIKPYSTLSNHARAAAIESIKWIRSELRGRLDFVMTLVISGDLYTATGGTNYDWST